jgi:hypothetical protein
MYLFNQGYYMADRNGSQTQEEMNKMKDWLSKDDPITIVTHQKVDADAAFSAALLKVLRPHAALVFVRADAEIEDERTIAVDLSNGSRAVKGLEAGSAFGLIVQVMKDIDRPVYNALRSWASQLNLTDSGKTCDDSVVLSDLVNSWRLLGFNDVKIVARSAELLLGKIQNEKNFQKQKSSAKSLSINGGVVVIPEETHLKASHLFKRGAKAVIRQSDCGQCVLISREMQNKGILLNELENLLPDGWFVHPQGFMACFGSVKAPKDYRDSGISLDDLTTVVKTWIKSHEKADNFADALIARANVGN